MSSEVDLQRFMANCVNSSRLVENGRRLVHFTVASVQRVWICVNMWDVPGSLEC